MYHIRSLLTSWQLQGKRVFVRADLNVPMSRGNILDDYRLKSFLPTLSYLREQQSTIIIATHIGRPRGINSDLSTQHLIPWFTAQGFTVKFVADPDALITQNQNSGTIFLLENLRFSAEEKDKNKKFAQTLASLADYYVDDAFGTLHRGDASIAVVPHFFPKNHRTIGFLVERELTALNTILECEEQPFVLMLAGGKVTDKVPLIMALMDKISTVLIGPAIANSFLKALGHNLGVSPIDETLLALCKDIIAVAQQKNVALILPIDFVVARGSFDGPLIANPVALDAFPSDGVAISIGPETLKIFAHEIMKARTLFCNGLMGSLSRPETLDGMQKILNAINQSEGSGVIAGGDSVAAAIALGFSNKNYYLSTGGGATLTYLSTQRLPGIEALSD